MTEILVDVLLVAAVLMIIGGVVMKRKEKAAAGAKPISRYLFIGGPVLLVAAVALVVLDPEMMAQFTGAFGEGEKAGKAAATKVLPSPAASPGAKSADAAKQAPAPDKAAAEGTKADVAKADVGKADAAKGAVAKADVAKADAAKAELAKAPSDAAAKPAPVETREAAADAPRMAPWRSLPTTRDLRRCLDLQSNLEVIKCAERS